MMFPFFCLLLYEKAAKPGLISPFTVLVLPFSGTLRTESEFEGFLNPKPEP